MSKKFRRHNSHALKRVSTSWRKPRGTDNKVRYGFRSYVNRVRVGYGTSKKSDIVLISSLTDLQKVAGTDAVIVFASTLGTRKKLDLLKKAAELKIKIANVADDFTSKIEAELKLRKESKNKKAKAKEIRQKELDKKVADAEKKSKVKEEKSEDDKKSEEKKAKDKILTQKA